MAQGKRFQALGPLLAGEGSRAWIGLEHWPDGRATPVVLVWVPEEANKDQQLMDRIRRETDHASKLEHPNIVRVAGFARLDEGFARVVEFADGESLRKLIDQIGRVPAPFAARAVCDAARGVHYAHLAGNDDGTPLMHGDLRPETILVSFTGTAKVTGYGALAFAPREHGGQRVKGRRVHTAPEQIIGGRGAMTLQTDVYLLGLTLYEALTGKVPFTDAQDFDQAVLTEPLPPAPDDIPSPLWTVISRACSKKAPDRYPTPLAFREAVELALGGVPTSEELSNYLKTVYPESDSVRAARRQAIDAGIADHVRKQWAERAAAPATATPAPATTPVLPPAAAPRPPAAAAPPAAPKPAPVRQPPKHISRPHPVVSNDWADEPTGSGVHPAAMSNKQLLAGIGILVAVVLGVVFAILGASKPTPSMERFVREGGLDAGSKPVVIVPPPAPIVEDAGATAAAPVDAGAPVAVPAPAPTPTPTPTPPAQGGFGVLELDVDPNCEVEVDGKSLGKTPIRASLPVGRKVVRLTNKALGISTSRTVHITAGDKTEESIRLGKGYVQISAPEGAQVFIDDLRIGTAPIRGEVPVYEGRHEIRVNIGNSKWNEHFNITKDKRVSFSVNAQ